MTATQKIGRNGVAMTRVNVWLPDWLLDLIDGDPRYQDRSAAVRQTLIREYGVPEKRAREALIIGG
jgi:metal-responsive CopG/Arc/MetJ family transcriptional regulator